MLKRHSRPVQRGCTILPPPAGRSTGIHVAAVPAGPPVPTIDLFRTAYAWPIPDARTAGSVKRKCERQSALIRDANEPSRCHEPVLIQIIAAVHDRMKTIVAIYGDSTTRIARSGQ
jgi:hypothetical protein